MINTTFMALYLFDKFMYTRKLEIKLIGFFGPRQVTSLKYLAYSINDEFLYRRSILSV